MTNLNQEQFKAAIETLLFVSEEPVRIKDLVELFGGALDAENIEKVLAEIRTEYEGRPPGSDSPHVRNTACGSNDT
jgi:chromosome segregation and condensation protein ScpB